jgi:hypothetical protein
MYIGINTIGTSLGGQRDIKNEPPIPNQIVSPWIDPFLNEYFDKNRTIEYKLGHPCKKSTFITTLRKIGNIKNQYVTNVYYLDTLIFSYDECEIYSSYNDEYGEEDYSPVYSSYHSSCDYCKEHKQKVKGNLIVGYKIYPRGVLPEKTYKQRKEEWKKFQ